MIRALLLAVLAVMFWAMFTGRGPVVAVCLLAFILIPLPKRPGRRE